MLYINQAMSLHMKSIGNDIAILGFRRVTNRCDTRSLHFLLLAYTQWSADPANHPDYLGLPQRLAQTIPTIH